MTAKQAKAKTSVPSWNLRRQREEAKQPRRGLVCAKPSMQFGHINKTALQSIDMTAYRRANLKLILARFWHDL